MEHRKALIIFAKVPVAGQVKTRLVPPLSGEEAAKLYEAFLKDTLELAKSLEGVRVVLAVQGGPLAPALLAQCQEHFEQVGQNLGEKMAHAFEKALKDAKDVVIIGSDTPHLPQRTISQAFRALDHQDLVLGPAEDGGYYLIGLSKPAPRLFDSISWSTPSVFKDTMAQAEKLDLPTALLHPLYDIDTSADLIRLWEELQKAPKRFHTKMALSSLMPKVFLYEEKIPSHQSLEPAP